MSVRVTLDEIFDFVDDAFREDRFDDVDRFLESTDTVGLGHELLVGILSATFPGRRWLCRRERFLAAVEGRLRADGVEDVDGLLSGLR